MEVDGQSTDGRRGQDREGRKVYIFLTNISAHWLVKKITGLELAYEGRNVGNQEDSNVVPAGVEWAEDPNKDVMSCFESEFRGIR